MKTRDRWPVRLRVVLAIALVGGLALRIYKFPHVPAGLNQDEISSTYESYSLLKTGADRWGKHLPLYFMSWGSGQSVLQSYLQVPVVAIFGLTPVGVRLLPLLLGILTLPVFFFALKVVEGAEAACAGTLMLAVSPWHVMLSRWGLEANLLPLFILLGLLTYSTAIDSGRKRRIVPSLLPFAFALYAYGMAVLIVPPLVVLLLCMNWKAVRRQRLAWAGAAAFAFAVGSPIVFFTVKNYVTKRSYAWERHLPFSVPLLPETRLSQVSFGNPLAHNLYFLRHGLQDHSVRNQVPGLLPLPWFMLALAAFGVFVVLRQAIEGRAVNNTFLPWLVASAPVLMKVPVNVNQANTLFLPLLAMAAVGFARLAPSPRHRAAVTALLCSACIVSAALFSRHYFGRAYLQETESSSNPSLPLAFQRLDALQPAGLPVFITESIILNYMQTLFYLQIDPRTFQLSGATYARPEFGNYVFHRRLALQGRNTVFLLRSEDQPLCTAPARREEVGSFVVGVCGPQP